MKFNTMFNTMYNTMYDAMIDLARKLKGHLQLSQYEQAAERGESVLLANGVIFTNLVREFLGMGDAPPGIQNGVYWQSIRLISKATYPSANHQSLIAMTDTLARVANQWRDEHLNDPVGLHDAGLHANNCFIILAGIIRHCPRVAESVAANN